MSAALRDLGVLRGQFLAKPTPDTARAFLRACVDRRDVFTPLHSEILEGLHLDVNDSLVELGRAYSRVLDVMESASGRCGARYGRHACLDPKGHAGSHTSHGGFAWIDLADPATTLAKVRVICGEWDCGGARRERPRLSGDTCMRLICDELFAPGSTSRFALTRSVLCDRIVVARDELTRAAEAIDASGLVERVPCGSTDGVCPMCGARSGVECVEACPSLRGERS